MDKEPKVVRPATPPRALYVPTSHSCLHYAKRTSATGGGGTVGAGGAGGQLDSLGTFSVSSLARQLQLALAQALAG